MSEKKNKSDNVDCSKKTDTTTGACIPLPRLEKPTRLPDFEVRANEKGYAVVIIRENGNESAAVLNNTEVRKVIKALKGISSNNGLDNQKV